MQDESIDVPGTRRRLLAMLACGALLGAAPGAWRTAQAAQPAAGGGRPIRLILPVGVGSGVGTITRSAGAALTRAWGQNVVIENLPGAGGIVGTSAIVREPADGHTLGMVSNNHATFPSVYKSVPFDPLRDITPISVIGSTPLLLVVNPKRLPARTVPEVIALIKARPGYYNHASSGNGTILHLAVEMFLHQAGLSARHIPYRGVGPMMTDLIGGQVDIGVLSLPSVLPQLQSGALVAVGECGARRNAVLPQLPTLREQGLPDYEVTGWFALIGPRGLPDVTAQRLYEGARSAFASDEVRAAMAAQGNEIAPMTPAQSAQFLASEARKYAQIVKAAGIEAQ